MPHQNNNHPAVVHVIEALDDEVSCCSSLSHNEDEQELPLVARPALQIPRESNDDIIWRSRRRVLQMLETRYEQKQQARTTSSATNQKKQATPPPQSPASASSSVVGGASAALDCTGLRQQKSAQNNRDLLVQLEAMLFATATTFEDYMDETTLEARLKNLFVAVLTRRLNQHSTARRVSSSRRSRQCQRRSKLVHG